MSTRLPGLVSLALLLGCASAPPRPQLAPGSPGYVAPTERTIVAESEPSVDVQEIYVENNSSAVVVVTNVNVIECKNVTPCGLVPLHVQVDPGQRRKVLSIRPVDSMTAWSYRYRYGWSVLPGR
ncbi:MAG TPA: hypothetical protein VLW50_32095 [Streptosporangiaceae bacterium]|nr:hypothetical protein [Streptosporangiaceae bacterium]